MRSRPFEQLWRVRQLVEELSQRELANRTAELRRLEETAGHLQTGALASRRTALDGLGESFDGKEWQTGLADAQILEWGSKQLRRDAEAEKPKISATRDELLERRMERLQAETLVEAARRAEAQETGRREQQWLDDWFHRRTKPENPG
jgi:flagellar export protein FliJ